MKSHIFVCVLICILLFSFSGCYTLPESEHSEEPVGFAEETAETADRSAATIETIQTTLPKGTGTSKEETTTTTTQKESTTTQKTANTSSKTVTTQTTTISVKKSTSLATKATNTSSTKTTAALTTTTTSVKKQTSSTSATTKATTGTTGEIPVRELRVDDDCITLSPGQTYRAMVIVSPYTATNQTLSWSSSDPSVATVDENGLITGVWEGFTMITATAHNGLSAFVGVYVNVEIEDKCSLETPALPYTVHHYSYRGEIVSSFIITDIQYSFEERYTKGKVNLTLSFAGEKTYDADGETDLKTGYICWRLFDSEGYLVDSGTYYIDPLCVGEKVRNCEEKIYDIEPGAYRLEIVDKE